MTQRLTKRVRCQSDKLNKDDNYISLTEAKELLFLHESTIRYYIIKQRIKAFKSGGRWYLSKIDVENFKRLHDTDQRKTD